MSEHDFRPTISGGASDVDALERFVIDTARDDQPPQGARARLLDSPVLTVPLSSASRSRGSIVRMLSGRGIYAVGLALLATGATVGFARFAPDRPAASPSHGAAPTATATATAPSDIPAVLTVAEPPAASVAAEPKPPPTKITPPRGVASARTLAEHTVAAAPKPAVPSTASKTSPSSGATTSTLDREIAHMSTVRTALARGDASRALQLLDAYDTEFPSGAFHIDVSVLRIEALARSGRTTEARNLGERFLAKYPESASARRVIQTLRNIASPNQDASLPPPPR